MPINFLGHNVTEKAPNTTLVGCKMQKLSERGQLIRDLFLILVLLEINQADGLIDSLLNLPTVPTIGSIIYPNQTTQQLAFDLIFELDGQVSELLEMVISRRYLGDRRPGRTHEEFSLAQMFDMQNEDFKQAVRTTKSGFVWILEKIYTHPIFYSNSRRPQLPIPHQLALTLERLGSNGNGASVGRFSRNLSVGRGTVIKVTRRVIVALNSLSERYIGWPNQERRQEISEVMKAEGFNGCVGFVDGTTIPLS